MNTQSNQSNNEIKMLHEVIADYKLQNEKLIEENKFLKHDRYTCDSCKASFTGCGNPICKDCIREGIVFDKKVLENKLTKENKELKAALVNSVVENEQLPEHALMIDKLNEEFSVAQDTIIKGEKLLLQEKEKTEGLECAFQDLLIEYIKSSAADLVDEELILNGGRINYQHLVKNILDRMNAEDWNEDGGCCELELAPTTTQYFEKCCEFIITTNCKDSDEED